MAATSAAWVAVGAGGPQLWPYAASGGESGAAAKVGRKGGRWVVRSDIARCRRTQVAKWRRNEWIEVRQRRLDRGHGLQQVQAMIVRSERWREGSGGAGEKGGRAVDLLPLGGDGAKHWLRGGGGPNGERGGSSGGGSALGCGGRTAFSSKADWIEGCALSAVSSLRKMAVCPFVSSHTDSGSSPSPILHLACGAS